MGKKLIIAEKPSVATDLQKVIGGMERIKTEAGDYSRVISTLWRVPLDICWSLLFLRNTM